MPGILAIAFSICLAAARLPAPFTPTTCTLIGAGRPKLRIWLVMSAGWKKKMQSGNRLGSTSRSLAT